MDIIIVSTNNVRQAEYWQQRLSSFPKLFNLPCSYIFVIHEDWPGGAGNGLGTLYTYQKAREQGKKQYGVDILAEQEAGASVAIYHTAGQGTRLFPLTASEYNNKSAVKLSAFIKKTDPKTYISVLEAVLKQTTNYGKNRIGRLSVFWADQLFLPSPTCEVKSQYHIDIFAKFLPFPTREEWDSQGLCRYGLIARNSQGAKHFDKIDYESLEKFVDKGIIKPSNGLGISLGSFSLSTSMLMALLEEFHSELRWKNAQMDCEPYVWMPTTLDEEDYVQLMFLKGVSQERSIRHYQRMQNFKRKFGSQHYLQPYFGAIDIGSDGYWWDYGNLSSYFENHMKITQDAPESHALRQFFKIDEMKDEKTNGLDVDDTSVLIGCEIKSGVVRNCVLVGVRADHVDLHDSVGYNVVAKSIAGESCLLYNVVEERELKLAKNKIRADIFFPDTGQHAKIYTEQGRDGKEDWKIKLPPNPFTYEEFFVLNKDIDLREAEAFAYKARERLLDRLDTEK